MPLAARMLLGALPFLPCVQRLCDSLSSAHAIEKQGIAKVNNATSMAKMASKNSLPVCCRHVAVVKTIQHALRAWFI